MQIDPSRHRGSRDNSDRGSTPGLVLWGRIVTELARLQDAASPESPGSVVNPICGVPYIVDTCCAAAVFAAEYRRTDDPRWRERADDAVTAARSDVPFRGVSEPTWDGALGWHDVPASLPATGIAVDAYGDALIRLGRPPDGDHVDDLLDLLVRCRTEAGGFAHNAVLPGHEAAEVQNATASALNLLGRLADGTDKGHPLYTGIGATVVRLGRGQRASGFWPYGYPGAKVTLKEALDRRPFKSLLRSVGFFPYGDVTHHLMTLHFAAGYFSSAGPTSASTGTRVLSSGWSWIRKRLVYGTDRSMSIDWSDDYTPRSPKSSNARDTNAYFLILGALPRLASLGIVDSGEARTIAEALLAHLVSNLAAESGHTPCVIPHESSPEIAPNLLPMFEQSVAWKGSLMAETILARHEAPSS